LSSLNQELQNKSAEFYSREKVMKEEHKIQIEKVKHLYKILKESKDGS